MRGQVTLTEPLVFKARVSATIIDQTCLEMCFPVPVGIFVSIVRSLTYIQGTTRRRIADYAGVPYRATVLAFPWHDIAERRHDPHDRKLYTLCRFVEKYGGSTAVRPGEWRREA